MRVIPDMIIMLAIAMASNRELRWFSLLLISLVTIRSKFVMFALLLIVSYYLLIG